MIKLKLGKELISVWDSLSNEECAKIHSAVSSLLSEHSEYEVLKAIAAYCGCQAYNREIAPTCRTMAAQLDTELMELIRKMAVYQHRLLADEEKRQQEMDTGLGEAML